MYAKYAATGAENAATASYTTVLHVTGAATVRPGIYDFSIGQGGTPADQVAFWAAMRFTVAPTSTAVVPTPLDGAEIAAESTAGENASAEGTYTAGTELFEAPVNVRATYRWVSAPDGELVVPATAANGIGLRVKAASYTGSAETTIHFAE